MWRILLSDQHSGVWDDEEDVAVEVSRRDETHEGPYVFKSRPDPISRICDSRSAGDRTSRGEASLRPRRPSGSGFQTGRRWR